MFFSAKSKKCDFTHFCFVSYVLSNYAGQVITVMKSSYCNSQDTAASHCRPNYSDLTVLWLASLCVSLSPMLEKTSANTSVPVKISAVPTQWLAVNGLSKYAMDMSRERNLRSVTTSVTDSDVHSVVSINTDLIHMYLAQQQRQGTFSIIDIVNIHQKQYSTSRVQTPGYIPKWVDPSKKPPIKPTKKPTSTKVWFCSLCH